MPDLLAPFAYDYMVKAIWVSALVGTVCAFLSAYLMLKGWSLMGDALGHSIVPGVAGAYILGAPFAMFETQSPMMVEYAGAHDRRRRLCSLCAGGEARLLGHRRGRGEGDRGRHRREGRLAPAPPMVH